MPAARQLCRASRSIAPTERITTCPVCGTKVSPDEHVMIEAQGQRVKRFVIPSHRRNEHGELKVKAIADHAKYPGVV